MGLEQQSDSLRAHPVDWTSGGLDDEGLPSDTQVHTQVYSGTHRTDVYFLHITSI
jgi:hypothetical protein